MGNKKRHINSEADLINAMRLTGYIFPKNDHELASSLKLKNDIDIDALCKKLDAEEIWNATKPKEYKKAAVVTELTIDTESEKQWGIAAKGSPNISEKIWDRIKKNQEKKSE